MILSYDNSGKLDELRDDPSNLTSDDPVLCVGIQYTLDDLREVLFEIEPEYTITDEQLVAFVRSKHEEAQRIAYEVVRDWLEEAIHDAALQ